MSIFNPCFLLFIAACGGAVASQPNLATGPTAPGVQCPKSPTTVIPKPADTTLHQKPRSQDGRGWIRSRVTQGLPIFTNHSGTCVEWQSRVLSTDPLKVLLTNSSHFLHRRIFVMKTVFTLGPEGLTILVLSDRTWHRRLESTKWKLVDEGYSQEYMPREPLLVDDGRAVAVFGNSWWWFGTYDDCRRDQLSSTPHTFQKRDSFEEDDDSWPLQVKN